MKVVNKQLKELKMYENNPRNNDEAVQSVANSIKEFGFKVPMVIDKNNVIVCGHTRYKACIELGIKEVPCVVADDLSEDQIKAFRLVENKTNELATWDFDKLDQELINIDIDMRDFDFDIIYPGEEEFEEDCYGEYDDIEKLDKHYGVPYQGNKSRIADIIISILPTGNRFVDLFGGGGAMTHCALLSDKWQYFLYNDINKMITTLFMDAIYGKYHDEKRVITRQDFEELKDSDPYVKYIWSFGNNGTGYLWGADIEDIKCTACHSLMDETLNERRLAYRRLILMLKEKRISSMDRLQSIEHLQALTQLEALQRLEALQIDYRDYQYQDGDVVYCDVPYEQINKNSCDDYGLSFNSKEFYEWVKSRDYPVYFSSYEISDKSFYSKKIKDVQMLIGANTNGMKKTEYLYSNRPFE